MTNQNTETLYLLDGSGFIFRAYHALPPMTRADGTPVNAVYGFCNILAKLLAEFKAKHIAVIFDAARKNFRNDIYAEYKAHRPPAPEELVPQFPLVREATRAFGIPALEADNFEADDLIATYARLARAKGWLVKIVSSDKDLMQLMRDGVELYDPMKSKPIVAADVLEKFGVTPDRVVDVQALAGDSSDNVPGVPGIGVKTAAQLIEEYGTLENLLAKANDIKQPKRRDALVQNADLARISKRLVTLRDDAPVSASLETLVARTDHHDEMIAFLQAQGFRSILKKVMAEAPLPEEAAPLEGAADRPASAAKPTNKTFEVPDQALLSTERHAYELVQDAAALQRWVNDITAQGFCAIDTETTSLVPSVTGLVGISLATAVGKACYIPLDHQDPEAAAAGELLFAESKHPKQMALQEAIELLKPLCADRSILKIGHNLKFDMQVLGQHGLVFNAIDDTLLLSFALGAGAHGHGLDELVQRHFGHKMISYDEVTGTGKARISFAAVPLAQACAYAAEDADYTLRLWYFLKPQLAQQHVTRVYETIEKPLVPVVAAMETAGIRVDPALLQGLSARFGKKMAELEISIHKHAGHSFNVGSPKQLGDVLFGEMGLTGSAKGKNGAYSTSSDILEPLAEQGHEIVSQVLEWRGLAKLQSTYADALPEQIQKKTGRVHTSFSMTGAATGRFASTDPNLQNIPIRTEDGRAIRRAFVPAEDCVLMSVDYSQIELRLVAEIAGIERLIEAFKEGDDIHKLTAAQVFGVPLQDVKPEQRRAAKAINFGIIYGISGFGLAKQIGCTQAEANMFIRDYLFRYQEMKQWMDDIKEGARRHGYVTTLFGRRIHIAGINEKIAARRGFAERQAINAPIQGTAADIIKRAMVRIPPALAAAGLKTKMLLQVHDELLFDVPFNERDAAAALVKQIMEQAPLPVMKLRIPLVAEVGFGSNWADAH